MYKYYIIYIIFLYFGLTSKPNIDTNIIEVNINDLDFSQKCIVYNIYIVYCIISYTTKISNHGIGYFQFCAIAVITNHQVSLQFHLSIVSRLRVEQELVKNYNLY